jgi:hypothetical protein
VSSDEGNSWTAQNQGLDAAQVGRVRALDGSILEAGLGGAFRYEHDGAWQRLDAGTRFTTTVDANGSHIFLGTEDKGLRLSYDSGATWHSWALSAAEVSAVQVSPSYVSDGTVFAAADYLYVSTNRGVTWRASSGIAGNDLRGIAFSPAFDQDGIAFAATINHQVYRTTDSGVTWTRASTGLPAGQISDILPTRTFSADRTVYAATGGSGVYVSHDAGDTWSSLPNQPPERTTSALTWTGSGALVVGSERGAFLSSAGGWQTVGGNWDGYVTDLADSIVNGAEMLYVGTLGDGVWQFQLESPDTPSPTVVQPAIVTPTATSFDCCSKPPATPTRVAKVVRAWVDPKPLHRGESALLRVAGPPGASAQVRMSARRWLRTANLYLDDAGHGSVGFFAPRMAFKVTVHVHSMHSSGVTNFTVAPAP